MIWDANTAPYPLVTLSAFSPLRVLDEMDGPRLFTVRSDDGQLFLAYSCAEDDANSRYLLVPTSDRLIARIEQDELCVRDALTQQAVMLVVDVANDGRINLLGRVDPETLPEDALPRDGVTLHPAPAALLRVRQIGPSLRRGNIPASVIKRGAEAVTNAVKVLVRHVLDLQPEPGRVAERFRRYYDLPATDLAFRSFEISFGMPAPAVQQELVDDQAVLEQVAALLDKGLRWASDESSPPPVGDEGAAIVEAMSHLAPPQRGVVESVEVGGSLAKRVSKPLRLTRDASERIASARKQLAKNNRGESAYEGFVTEFDKELLSFKLRGADGTDLLQVAFTEEQYEDAWLAFDTSRLVTVFAYRARSSSKIADLRSIAFKGEVLSPDAAEESS